MELTSHTLGRVQLPLRIRIAGSKAPPLEFPIDARSVGPHLLFGPMEAPPAELSPASAVAFDSVCVLDVHVHTMQVGRCLGMHVCM